jgi:endonuclease/exonuclease/phosphatase (EEP) superfamily protein YafD
MSRLRVTRRGVLAAALSAPWIAWAVVRGFGLDQGYPLVPAMAFTPFVAATSVAPVILALALRQWIVGGIAVVAAVVLIAAVLPRAIDGPHVAKPGTHGRTVVVMTSNGLFGHADAGTLLRLVREHHVDVLSLQEMTLDEVHNLDRAGIRRLLPGRVLDPGPTATGSGLMTRGTVRRVSDAATSGPLASPEGAVRLPDGLRLHIKVVHPIPPISRSDTATWRATLASLPGPRAGAEPRILVGDFNGTLDQRAVRHVLDRGFYDAADATGDGLRATWPVARPRPMITIDHVLAPAGFLVSKVSVFDIPGSDHRALIAELVLPT